MKKKLTIGNFIQGIITFICVAVLVIAGVMSKSGTAIAESDTTDTAYRVYVYDGDGDLIANKKIEAGSLVTVKIPLYRYTKASYEDDDGNTSYYYKLTGRLKGIRPPSSSYELPDFAYFTINQVDTDSDERDKSTISYMFWMPYSTLYVQADYIETNSADVVVNSDVDKSNITEYFKVASTPEPYATDCNYVEMSSLLGYGSAGSFDTSSYLVDTDLIAYSATDTTTYYTLSLLSDSSTLATKYAGQLVTYAGVLDDDTDIDYLEFIDAKARNVSYDSSTGAYTTVEGNTFEVKTYRYLSSTGERKYLITFAMPPENIRISNIVTKDAQTIENEAPSTETEEAATTLAETVNSQGEYEVISNPAVNTDDTAYQQKFYVDAGDIQANRDAILELQDQMSGISIFYVAQDISGDGDYIVPQDVQDVLYTALGKDTEKALTFSDIKTYIPDTGYYIISSTDLTSTAIAKNGYSGDDAAEYAKSLCASIQKLANLPDDYEMVLVSNVESSKADYSTSEFKEYCDTKGYIYSTKEDTEDVVITSGWYMIAEYGTDDSSITKAIKISDEVVLVTQDE